MPLTHFDLILRITVAAALGSTIGLERDLHGRHVGLRTHLLVATAAATFMVLSAHFVFFQGYAPDQKFVEVDASRIAASIVSAVGFLAGGAILRTGATVQGLTTAAGLWLVTAIGMCAGSGMYVEAVYVDFLGIVALTVLRRFEDKDVIRRQVSLELAGDPPAPSDLLSALAARHVLVSDFEYERRIEDKRATLTFDVRLPRGITLPRFIEDLERERNVVHVRVQSTT
jgi:putative Mg2+ transporter-C (MgtC) family protein